MDQRLTLVTLGVDDVERSAAFYERLGWRRSASSVAGEVAFFQLNGIALALFGRDALAKDAGVPAGGRDAASTTLAINCRDRAEVDRTCAELTGAGATPLRPPAETFWGGYGGYVADPDGHVWEVAHNPFWQLDDKGNVRLD